jgi:serine/threonine protein kinase
MPNTQTLQNLNDVMGYVLDGTLFAGHGAILICFKDAIPNVMKICTEVEYDRALKLKTAAASSNPCKFIIGFDLYQMNNKYFMFMPLHPVTLESLRVLKGDEIFRFYQHMSSALDFLHALGFAHMDVKPSNILISSTGDFILADLGSVALFGTKSQSTRSYLPREMWINGLPPKAHRSVDWWMLAMTMYKKVVGKEIGGTSEPFQQAVKSALAGELPEKIWADLVCKLT